MARDGEADPARDVDVPQPVPRRRRWPGRTAGPRRRCGPRISSPASSSSRNPPATRTTPPTSSPAASSTEPRVVRSDDITLITASTGRPMSVQAGVRGTPGTRCRTAGSRPAPRRRWPGSAPPLAVRVPLSSHPDEGDRARVEQPPERRLDRARPASVSRSLARSVRSPMPRLLRPGPRVARQGLLIFDNDRSGAPARERSGRRTAPSTPALTGAPTTTRQPALTPPSSGDPASAGKPLTGPNYFIVLQTTSTQRRSRVRAVRLSHPTSGPLSGPDRGGRTMPDSNISEAMRGALGTEMGRQCRSRSGVGHPPVGPRRVLPRQAAGAVHRPGGRQEQPVRRHRRARGLQPVRVARSVQRGEGRRPRAERPQPAPRSSSASTAPAWSSMLNGGMVSSTACRCGPAT